MNWTAEQIREAGRRVAVSGFSLAGRMLQAFSERRRSDIEAALKTGRKCVVCGKVILIGEDFIRVSDDAIACASNCDMKTARRIAAARVSSPLLALPYDAAPEKADAPGRVVNAWEEGAT